DPGAEWKVGEFRSSRPGFCCEAFRIEAQRGGEKPRVAMGDKLTYQYCRFRGQKEFSKAKVGTRVAAHRPRRRVEPHGFRKHHFDITQSGNIVEAGQTTSQNAIN